MKKTNKILLAGVTAITLGGMTACNNNDNTVSPSTPKGDTYAGMYISNGKSIQLRTITGTQNDFEGRAQESKLAALDFISSAGPMTWTLGAQDQDGKFWLEGTSLYKVAPWKTEAGQQTFALIANKGGITTPNVTLASDYKFGEGTPADIATLAKEDAFVMTSSKQVKTIAENKSKEDVKAATDEANNVFKMDIERVVAQGMVTKAADTKAEVASGLGSVDLESLEYAAVNSAANTYLFRDHAGNRTIDDASQVYTDYQSAIHDYKEFEAAKDAAAAKPYLIRLGNLGALADQGEYGVKKVAATAEAAKAERGIYFMENSVDNSALTEANKKFGFYRLAYAKIYATFVPKSVLTLGEDGKLMEMAEYTKGTTFYRGATDGLFYASVEAAKKGGNTQVLTYTNGKCFYRALWNRQVDVDGKTVKAADTRRNNIYLLTIKGFNTIGTPWDPSDPQDPNLPKPETPEEKPDGGDNPHIEKQETYMRVEATILPWNLVSRDVILD